MTYRVWVNEKRTVLVRLWENETVEVATRESPAHTWGPPVTLAEERRRPGRRIRDGAS